MTDKQYFEKDINVPSKEQIIINGVTYYKQQDINEGLDEEHYITEFHLLATHYNLLLEDYARKTQECEELKAYAQRQENQREEYYKEYIKLSQECEELKKKCNIYTCGICKYKNCLTEIKGIAEENIRIADLEGLNGVYRRGLAKQILQKISEVVE